jgi:argininosuccinate synthase
MSTVVLAVSGGLDTSFCVPYLRERGHDVVTLFVDTGGVSTEQRAEIEARAVRLGAKRHVTADGAEDVWTEVVVPLVYGGQLYQDQYPLLVSDRYVIVKRAVALADELGTNLVAHGCTGMGNDQVRFDLSVRALGDYRVLAPIRDIQDEHPNVRDYERGYLKRIGYEVPAKQTVYTINENLLGVTMSGSEIDEWKEPGPGTYQLTAPPSARPTTPLRVAITFEDGVATAIDGAKKDGPAILRELNARLGAHGVGRGIYTGDTTVGLKGRIVFEAPGLVALVAAHRALEEAVLTAQENAFKPVVAKKWVELVYKGFFFEPLKYELEAFLRASQRFVTGTVTLEACGGQIMPIAIDSAHVLRAKNAVYAQRADWSAKEAEGFIRLLGQSAALSADVNPRGASAKKPAS